MKPACSQYASKSPERSLQKKNLGPGVNSPQIDWFASVTPDGRYLFYSSNRTGAGDTYWVEAKVIEAVRARGK